MDQRTDKEVLTIGAFKELFEPAMAKIEQRFKGIDERFEGVDQKFEGVDQKFGGLNQRLDGIDRRLDGMDQRLDGVDRRLESIDQRFDTLESKMMEGFTMIDRKIDLVDKYSQERDENLLDMITLKLEENSLKYS